MTEHRIRPLEQRVPLAPLDRSIHQISEQEQLAQEQQAYLRAFLALDRAMSGQMTEEDWDRWNAVPEEPKAVPYRDRRDTPNHPMTTTYLQMLTSMVDRRIVSPLRGRLLLDKLSLQDL